MSARLGCRQPLATGSSLTLPTIGTGSCGLLPTLQEVPEREDGGSKQLPKSPDTGMALFTQHLDQERQERKAGLSALQRELAAQQLVLSQLAEHLLGDRGSPAEAILQGLQRDLASQQREQEIQASALREALLDLQQQQTEGRMWASELAEMRSRCGSLTDELSRLKNERSEVEARLEAELAAKLRHQEQRFALLVKAMEMERSARIKETAELRSMGVAAAECAEAINLERNARTSEAGELRMLVTAAVELAEVTATELRMPSFDIPPTARKGARSLSPSRPQQCTDENDAVMACLRDLKAEGDKELGGGHCHVRRNSLRRPGDTVVHISCAKQQVADATDGRPTFLKDDGDDEFNEFPTGQCKRKRAEAPHGEEPSSLPPSPAPSAGRGASCMSGLSARTVLRSIAECGRQSRTAKRA